MYTEEAMYRNITDNSVDELTEINKANARDYIEDMGRLQAVLYFILCETGSEDIDTNKHWSSWPIAAEIQEQSNYYAKEWFTQQQFDDFIRRYVVKFMETKELRTALDSYLC